MLPKLAGRRSVAAPLSWLYSCTHWLAQAARRRRSLVWDLRAAMPVGVDGAPRWAGPQSTSVAAVLVFAVWRAHNSRCSCDAARAALGTPSGLQRSGGRGTGGGGVARGTATWRRICGCVPFAFRGCIRVSSTVLHTWRGSILCPGLGERCTCCIVHASVDC